MRKGQMALNWWRFPIGFLQGLDIFISYFCLILEGFCMVPANRFLRPVITGFFNCAVTKTANSHRELKYRPIN